MEIFFHFLLPHYVVIMLWRWKFGGKTFEIQNGFWPHCRQDVDGICEGILIPLETLEELNIWLVFAIFCVTYMTGNIVKTMELLFSHKFFTLRNPSFLSIRIEEISGVSRNYSFHYVSFFFFFLTFAFLTSEVAIWLSLLVGKQSKFHWKHAMLKIVWLTLEHRSYYAGLQ